MRYFIIITTVLFSLTVKAQSSTESKKSTNKCTASVYNAKDYVG